MEEANVTRSLARVSAGPGTSPETRHPPRTTCLGLGDSHGNHAACSQPPAFLQRVQAPLPRVHADSGGGQAALLEISPEQQRLLV